MAKDGEFAKKMWRNSARIVLSDSALRINQWMIPISMICSDLLPTRAALVWCRWGAPNATDVSQTWGPPGCIEGDDHSADLVFVRWLALKRAFF
jgi:hypothetical protein